MTAAGDELAPAEELIDAANALSAELSANSALEDTVSGQAPKPAETSNSDTNAVMDAHAAAAHSKHHCRQCQLPLVEGRAYELGGFRWHVDCFLCSVCQVKLDADSNMLVLGNGTLVCSNCSYFCSVCQRKIEDLAILTNDQAFCSSCFVCRNCKRRIEDSKYARTSLGMFCMSCHELLLSRKQQRQRESRERKAGAEQANNGGVAITAGVSANNSAGTLASASVSGLASNNGERNSRGFEGRGQSRQKRQSTSRNISPARSNKQLPSLPRTASSNSASSFHGPFNNEKGQSIGAASAWQPQTGSSDLDTPALLRPPSDGNTRQSTSQSQSNLSKLADYSSSSSSLGSMPPSADSNSSLNQLKADALRAQEALAKLSLDHKPRETTSQGGLVTPKLPSDQSAQASPNTAEVTIEVRSTPGPVPQSLNDHANANSAAGNLSIPPRGHMRGVSQDWVNAAIACEGALDVSGHKRSFSEMPRSVAGQHTNSALLPPILDEVSSPPVDAESAMMAAALKTAQRRVLELEKQLAASESKVQRHSSSGSTSSTVRIGESETLERKKTIAGLEARQVMAQQELDAIRQARLLETENDAARALSDSLAQLKQSLESEIENMAATREKTKAEVEKLERRREQMAEELSVLSLRNQQLTDMNAEMTRQLKTKYGSSGLLTQFGSSANLELGSELSREPSLASQSTVSSQRTMFSQQTQSQSQLQPQSQSQSQSHSQSQSQMQPQSQVQSQSQGQAQTSGASLALAPDGKRARARRKEVGTGDRPGSRPGQSLSLSSGRSINEAVTPTRTPYGLTSNLQNQGQPPQFTSNSQYLARSANSSPISAPQNAMPLSHYTGNPAVSQPQMYSTQNNAGFGNTRLGEGALVTVLDASPIQYSRKGGNNAGGTRMWPWKRSGKNGTRTMAVEALDYDDEYGTAYGQNGSGNGGGLFGSGSAISALAGSIAGQASGLVGLNDEEENSFNLSPHHGGGHGNTSLGSAFTEQGLVRSDEKTILGDTLQQRLEIDKADIPNIVTRCVQEVERRGLKFEGIYRKSGSKSQIDALLKCFARRNDAEIENLIGNDIAAVTSTLKKYLHNLSKPVIALESYDAFVKAGRTGDQSHLSLALSQLPREHLRVLEYLVRHMRVVASREAQNLMTPRNLAVVFAPTLSRAPTDAQEAGDMSARNEAMQLLIENCDKLFDQVHSLV